MLSVQVDYGELWATMEAIESVSKKIDSAPFKRSAFRALTAAAAIRFNMWLDAQAEVDPDELWHVYEWGKIAEPSGRLFKMVFENSGNFSARSHWRFTESTAPVPHDLRIGGNQSTHYFTWKAYAFEYGLTMTVARKNASRLVWWDGSLQSTTGVTHPVAAGGDLAGNFTERWENFWGNQTLVSSVIYEVEQPFNQFVKIDVERYINRVVDKARKASLVATVAPPLGTIRVTNQGRPGTARVKTEELDISPLLAKWGKSWQ